MHSLYVTQTELEHATYAAGKLDYYYSSSFSGMVLDLPTPAATDSPRQAQAVAAVFRPHIECSHAFELAALLRISVLHNPAHVAAFVSAPGGGHILSIEVTCDDQTREAAARAAIVKAAAAFYNRVIALTGLQA